MKYFKLWEFTNSATAKRYGINNTPPIGIERNITALVDNVLDPLREKYGKAIVISSGYRCDKLNKIIGGSITSQHRFGEAADITVGNKENNKQLLKIIYELGIFDQLILEYGGQWVHVSYKRTGENRKQVLKTNDGRHYNKMPEEEIINL